MGFSGIKYSAVKKEPIRSLNGFYGIKIRLELTAIKVRDYRGRGQANVKVEVENPTSGIPFTGFTDSKGSVFVQLDSTTDITITKDLIKKTVTYDNQSGTTFEIDLPFIQ